MLRFDCWLRSSMSSLESAELLKLMRVRLSGECNWLRTAIWGLWVSDGLVESVFKVFLRLRVCRSLCSNSYRRKSKAKRQWSKRRRTGGTRRWWHCRRSQRRKRWERPHIRFPDKSKRFPWVSVAKQPIGLLLLIEIEIISRISDLESRTDVLP